MPLPLKTGTPSGVGSPPARDRAHGPDEEHVAEEPLRQRALDDIERDGRELCAARPQQRIRNLLMNHARLRSMSLMMKGQRRLR